MAYYPRVKTRFQYRKMKNRVEIRPCMECGKLIKKGEVKIQKLSTPEMAFHIECWEKYHHQKW